MRNILADEENVRRDSPRAWLLAVRPKTLTASLIPVVVACALAAHDGSFRVMPAAVCAAFAALMQIASNLVNDLYDYLKGTDGDDRTGPRRATAQGWISPSHMRAGIIIVTVLACAAGCLLLSQSSLWLAGVGVLCVAAAVLYTSTLSYLGLGDLLVLVFFGIVPVNVTYCLQTGSLTAETVLCSFACGTAIDTLLALNNFRDRDSDRRTGKRTIVVIFGETFGLRFYLALGIAAYLLAAAIALRGMTLVPIITMPYLCLHVSTWRSMARIRRGTGLNAVLGATSRNMAAFALLLAAGIMLS